MDLRLTYLHLTFAHSKVKVKVMHISIVNISKTRLKFGHGGDRANITIIQIPF